MKKLSPLNSSRSGEKYLQAFVFGFLCLLLSVLPIMIMENGYFIYGGDYNAQQINFYHTVNTAVRNGQFGWHWFTDLGTDLLTSYSFYLFGSPFFWLTTLLPASAVTYSMPILLAVKHGLAAMTAYAYIRRFVRSKDAALVGGLLYAFSGFQLFNLFFNHFQDVTAFFPLMLIAMEECINNKRRGVFALTVALMALINYYFFAGQAVFLVLYYLFRMKCSDFHTSWKKFGILAFEAVLGTAIAAVILLPSALDLLGNWRVSERFYGIDFIIYPDKTLPHRIFQSFFMPADPPSNPILFYSDYEQWASIGGYFPLFSMAGVAAFMKGRKKHWATRFSIFCIICAFVPVLNGAFQALNSYYYARWFYMPLLIFAMMTAQSLDDEDADIMFGWKLCAAVVGALALCGCVPTEGDEGQWLFLMLPEDIAYFWANIAIAAIGLAISYLLFKRRREGKTFYKQAVLLTLVSSVICAYSMLFYDALTVDNAKYYIDTNIKGGADVRETVSEDNFFRMDTSEGCDNMAMYWELPTMRTFHSVVDPSIMNFYRSIGEKRDVGSRADISHYTLRGLLSVKYYYRELYENKTYDEIKNSGGANIGDLASAIGFSTSLNNADVTEYMPGFEYTGTNAHFEIYENKLFIPMGFGYDTCISEAAAKKLTDEQRERQLIKSLILTKEQIARYSDIITEDKNPASLFKSDYEEFCRSKQQNCSSAFSYDSKGFRSEITLDKPQLVFFSVPYSKGWSAEVNGKKTDVELVSYGFMAVRAEAGENTIVFGYKTPGLKEGWIITGSALLILVIYLLAAHFISGNGGDDAGHVHCYDYRTAEKISAQRDHCRKFDKYRQEKPAPKKFFTLKLK